MSSTSTEARLENVPLKEIKPDPDQPRKHIDEAEMQRLVESVKERGVITPIRLRPNGKGYIIVAGERRFQAAKQANLKTIPAVITDTDSGAVDALVENIHRQDLNAIEEGDAYIALSKEGLSVDEVARQVSRSVDRVAQRMGLAQLPATARAAVIDGRMSIGDAIGWIPLALKAPQVAEAVAFVAARGGWWSQDPTWVLGQLNRLDDLNEEECSHCEGSGESGEENCAECKGTGYVASTGDPASELPKFFAWPMDGYSAPMQSAMLAQLTQDAQDRIAAAAKKAAKHHKEVSAGSGYFEPPPRIIFDSEDLTDVAVNGGYAVELGGTRHGSRRVLVTDPEFVSEYLPAIYESSVEAYLKSKSGRASSGKTAKKATEDLTAEEIKEKEERSAARQKATNERAIGREFNTRLGIAIAQNLGEVEVTTEAMKLLVKTILSETEQHDYKGIQGTGHALTHRFIREDWPAAKNGDWKIPRSADDCRAFVEKVYKQAYKELGQAKTPEQALAVLVRFLAPGLADLRGLPQADIDRMIPYGTESDAWRKFVKARLPKAVASKAPASNGIAGRSQAWG